MITIGGRSFDAATLMAPFVNALEKLDPALYLPLYNTTWMRDIQLREDINIGVEMTSFIRSKVAATGSQGYGGIPWVKDGADLMGVAVDGEKIGTILRPCAQAVAYNEIELARSQLLNQPIDRQKFDALNILYQMSVDEFAFIGSTTAGSAGETGLFNSSIVEYDLVDQGVSTYTTWANKTPAEIQYDVNKMLTKCASNSGFAKYPEDLLLNPVNFALIAGLPMTTGGFSSVLEWLKANNVSTANNGKPLNIRANKWLTERGQSTKNRMVAYTNSKEFVRLPLVPIKPYTAYYQGITFFRPYIWAMGAVEIVKPETIIYRDGI